MPLLWKKKWYKFRFRRRRLIINSREIEIKTEFILVPKKLSAPKRVRVSMMINNETKIGRAHV